ncbi:MAG: hypothetical protein DMF76_14900 [Acidobacteria bacterium]|nr:MAG: hypothetical protein DMF76_14900 [Acidobacteriota bacterium]
MHFAPTELRKDIESANNKHSVPTGRIDFDDGLTRLYTLDSPYPYFMFLWALFGGPINVR